MRNGKLTYPDIACLRAARTRGLRRYGQTWRSHFAGPGFNLGPVTTLIRAGYLEKNDDSEELHLILTRKGVETLGRTAPAKEQIGRDIEAAVHEFERLELARAS